MFAAVSVWSVVCVGECLHVMVVRTTTSASVIVLGAAGNVVVRDPESSILSEAAICFL